MKPAEEFYFTFYFSFFPCFKQDLYWLGLHEFVPKGWENNKLNQFICFFFNLLGIIFFHFRWENREGKQKAKDYVKLC